MRLPPSRSYWVSARSPGYGELVKPDNIAIRPAAHDRQDLAIVDAFIRELAKEEGLPDATASLDELTGALFGQEAMAHAVIADVDGKPAGFALYYPKYSTVTGRRGLHLEDIYVAPQYRDRHLGRRFPRTPASLERTARDGRLLGDTLQ